MTDIILERLLHDIIEEISTFGQLIRENNQAEQDYRDRQVKVYYNSRVNPKKAQSEIIDVPWARRNYIDLIKNGKFKNAEGDVKSIYSEKGMINRVRHMMLTYETSWTRLNTLIVDDYLAVRYKRIPDYKISAREIIRLIAKIIQDTHHMITKLLTEITPTDQNDLDLKHYLTSRRLRLDAANDEWMKAKLEELKHDPASLLKGMLKKGKSDPKIADALNARANQLSQFKTTDDHLELMDTIQGVPPKKPAENTPIAGRTFNQAAPITGRSTIPPTTKPTGSRPSSLRDIVKRNLNKSTSEGLQYIDPMRPPLKWL